MICFLLSFLCACIDCDIYIYVALSAFGNLHFVFVCIYRVLSAFGDFSCVCVYTVSNIRILYLVLESVVESLVRLSY